MNDRQIYLAVFILLIFGVAAALVYGSGGGIEGKVTDPKGAVVVGASVVVSDPMNSRTLNATTDQDGKYKIEGLPPGTYSLTVSARGFSDAHRNDVKVNENAVATINVQLEIAPVEAGVIVPAKSNANVDPVYQQLRQLAKNQNDFGGPFATVNNLVFKRDAAVFTLHRGEVYFGPPVEGRVTAGVFIGDGELTLVPPTTIEKHSLSLFIDQEKLTEPFSHLVLRFTDQTLAEIKGSANAKMGTGGPQAEKARDLYRDNQQLLRKELHDNAEIRTLTDIYSPPRPGYFNAFVGGRKHSKLVFLLDPLGIPAVSPEEIALVSYGETDAEFGPRSTWPTNMPGALPAVLKITGCMTLPAMKLRGKYVEHTSQQRIASPSNRWWRAESYGSTCTDH